MLVLVGCNGLQSEINPRFLYKQLLTRLSLEALVIPIFDKLDGLFFCCFEAEPYFL